MSAAQHLANSGVSRARAMFGSCVRFAGSAFCRRFPLSVVFAFRDASLLLRLPVSRAGIHPGTESLKPTTAINDPFLTAATHPLFPDPCRFITFQRLKDRASFLSHTTAPLALPPTSASADSEQPAVSQASVPERGDAALDGWIWASNFLKKLAGSKTPVLSSS